MPCTYYLPGEAPAVEADSLKAERDKLKTELDTATRLLCELTKNVKTSDTKIKGLKEWKTKHKKMDQERLAHERKMQKARIALEEAGLRSIRKQRASAEAELARLLREEEAAAKRLFDLQVRMGVRERPKEESP